MCILHSNDIGWLALELELAVKSGREGAMVTPEGPVASVRSVFTPEIVFAEYGGGRALRCYASSEAGGRISLSGEIWR